MGSLGELQYSDLGGTPLSSIAVYLLVAMVVVSVVVWGLSKWQKRREEL